MNYILIAIINDIDVWYRFTTKAACHAHALVLDASWYSCVQVGI